MMNKQEQIKKFKGLAEKYGVEWDTIDFDAIVDNSLEYSENLKVIQYFISNLSASKNQEDKIKADFKSKRKSVVNEKEIEKDLNLKQLKSQLEQASKNLNVERNNEEILTHRNTEIEIEIADYNNTLKFNYDEKVDEYYKPLIRAITKLIKGYSNIVFIKGKGGIGKSYQIEKLLRKYNSNFVEYGGSNVSEAYLYRLLYENRHKGEVIYFKDVAVLLKGIEGIDLIKMATETRDKRLITKANYSKKQDDLPSRFLYEGSLIFDFNSLMGLNFRGDFEALTSRGDFIELSLSFDELKELMLLICEDEEQKEITKFLIEKYDYIGNQFNLRTQYRAFQTYRYSKENGLEWKKEIEEELKQNMSPIRRILYEFLGKNYAKERDVIKFLIRSGYVSTIRTCERRINEWLEMEEIYSDGLKRNRSIGLNPISLTTITTNLQKEEVNKNEEHQIRKEQIERGDKKWKI